MIDDLPAFLLLISINGEKSPNPPPPYLSFPSSAFPLLLPPSFRPSLSPPPDPILPPSYHSLTLMPSSPSLKALDPVTPSPHVSGFKYILHGFISKRQHIFGGPNWILLHIYIELQTIVHMILSRSVHQNTYGDVIKAFL